MKQKFTINLSSNLSLRILSIFLAACLWVFVINTDDPITTRTFSGMEVTIINTEVLSDLNQTYQITEGEKISFSIKGKKTIVDKLKKSDFVVTADLAELSSVNAVPIKIQAKKYADEIEIVYGNEKTLKLEIEDLQQAQVPVVAETVGEPAEGYTVGEKTTNPNLVNIKGPVSIVKHIKQVKVEVNVQGISKDIVTRIEPVCYDSDGEEVDNSRITMDVSSIKVKISMWKTKKIPLSIETTGEPAKGYTVGTIDYEPKYIYVTGEEVDLEEISEVELPSIDIDGKKSTVEETINLDSITLPDGISLAHQEKEVMVKVNIDKSSEKDLEISSEDIQILNNIHQYEVEFLDSKIDIHLSGLSSNLEEATLDNLKPRIDIESLGPGEHTVSIILEDISNVKISGDQTIQIVIKEKKEDSQTEED
ncbi:MAG: CdaR family protein [Lachnospiraceae bacterium]|nr:CdaR family protein [Lachnospiraceae bacterium]